MNSHPIHRQTPTSAQERYEFLDILRGFALIGIVSANMISYSLFLYLPDSVPKSMATYPIDRVLDFLELVVVEEKFYTIFSVLFGIGFAILLSRAKAKKLIFHRFFLRRVFLLYLIGVAHTVLFWHNDILQFYALCGALLLLFAGAGDRTIVVSSILALLAPIAIKIVGGIPSEGIVAIRDALFDRFGFTRETLVDTWTTGSLAEILRLNFSKWFDQLNNVVTGGWVFKIFGCFLVGLYLGRHEVFKKLETHRGTLKHLAIWGIAFGLPLNILYASTFSSESWLKTLSRTFGVLPLSAAYVSLLCLIWLGPRGKARLQCFAPVGRMALTNYVGQSVICTSIFYGTGLGLGGKMGPSLYLPIGLAVYLGQVLISRVWLDRFRFGPLEWLWRMLTYGTWIPLTKGTVSPGDRAP